LERLKNRSLKLAGYHRNHWQGIVGISKNTEPVIIDDEIEIEVAPLAGI
jgi:hypothetical protein